MIVLQGVALGVAVAIAINSAAAAEPIQLRFKSGQTVAVARAQIRPGETLPFLVDGRSGDHLKVTFDSNSGAGMHTYVIPPSGHDGYGGPGGRPFEDDLTESGTYRIEVTSRAARAQTIRLRVERTRK